MKIEAGRFYKTRDGRKVGPMSRPTVISDHPWRGEVKYADGHTNTLWYRGESGSFGSRDDANDIVAEWPRDSLEQVEAEMDAEIAAEKRGPVRTVTRKEIVQGYYGPVEVSAVIGDRVGIRISHLHGPGGPEVPMNAAELRAAAATLTEIADALGEAP